MNKPSSSRRQVGDTKLPSIESAAEIEQINGETVASNLRDERHTGKLLQILQSVTKAIVESLYCVSYS